MRVLILIVMCLAIVGCCAEEQKKKSPTEQFKASVEQPEKDVKDKEKK